MTLETTITFIREDFPVSDLDNPLWKTSVTAVADRYWSGETAPEGRAFKTDLLWSQSALYVRFDANQTEPLVVSDPPNLGAKTIGMWDRDVCEIFIAPDSTRPNRYFEFEVAPNGEWIDLVVEQFPDRRETDWEFESGMESAAAIFGERVVMAVKIGWNAFGATPNTRDEWRGNIFRCVGSGASRGYLAWSPTLTDSPQFHVPEKFGRFVFVG